MNLPSQSAPELPTFSETILADPPSDDQIWEIEGVGAEQIIDDTDLYPSG